MESVARGGPRLSMCFGEMWHGVCRIGCKVKHSVSLGERLRPFCHAKKRNVARTLTRTRHPIKCYPASASCARKQQSKITYVTHLSLPADGPMCECMLCGDRLCGLLHECCPDAIPFASLCGADVVWSGCAHEGACGENVRHAFRVEAASMRRAAVAEGRG